MPTHHRTGHRSGPTLATRRTSEDNLVAAYPGTAAVLVFFTALLALLTPAVLVLAAVRHLSVLGLIGAGASLLLYDGGYLAAVWHRRDLRAALNAARRDPVTGLPTRAVAEQALRTANVDRARLTVALAVDPVFPLVSTFAVGVRT